MSSIRLVQGNAFDLPLADESVHCVVTSPPYYGLRQYAGIGEWVGGDAGCDHREFRGTTRGGPLSTLTGGQDVTAHRELEYSNYCPKCGATREAPYGLESTLDEYIENTVRWAREVRRVLRGDGTFWLNLGDSYASAWASGRRSVIGNPSRTNRRINIQDGLKEKDLMGVPWRVALALQADGWWLRSDIIWSKPNPMPESVTDRPTKAHEYLFLLTKSARYYYDADAVREVLRDDPETYLRKLGRKAIEAGTYQEVGAGRKVGGFNTYKAKGGWTVPAGRNKRTVWNIATAPYSGAHFATYPPALVEPCIKAGTSERGVCPVCGAPWERVVDHVKGEHNREASMDQRKRNEGVMSGGIETTTIGSGRQGYNVTTGWRPTCTHQLDPIPATVLDPFVGSGTTLLVARELNRSGIGIDASWPYLSENARARLSLTALDEWTNGKPGATELSDLPMFGEL